MRKKVLLSPLYWGFGHVARMIPLRDQLKKSEYEIFWLIDTALKNFILTHCQDDHIIFNKEQIITYGNTELKTKLLLLKQSREFFKQIKKDTEKTDELQQTHGFDLIISDNRYGVYHPEVHSVLVTHQLNIDAGPLTNLVQRTNLKWMQNFNEIQVPDFPALEESLAGKLSHPAQALPESFHKRIKYIGPLSRFTSFQDSSEGTILVLLSGPEPQRSLLEILLLEILGSIKKQIIFVRGCNDNNLANTEFIEFIPFANGVALKLLFSKVEFVIARGGYSTLMDLYCANKKALFIPTPGQFEQEYLAQWNFGKHRFLFAKQTRKEIERALKLLLEG